MSERVVYKSGKSFRAGKDLGPFNTLPDALRFFFARGEDVREWEEAVKEMVTVIIEPYGQGYVIRGSGMLWYCQYCDTNFKKEGFDVWAESWMAEEFARAMGWIYVTKEFEYVEREE